MSARTEYRGGGGGSRRPASAALRRPGSSRVQSSGAPPRQVMRGRLRPTSAAPKRRRPTSAAPKRRPWGSGSATPSKTAATRSVYEAPQQKKSTTARRKRRGPRMTSAQHLRLAEEKRRMDERRFIAELQLDERKLEHSCAVWVREVTQWVQQLGHHKRSFRLVRSTGTGTGEGLDSAEAMVAVYDGNKEVRRMSLRAFERERAKIEQRLIRDSRRPKISSTPARGGKQKGGGTAAGDRERGMGAGTMAMVRGLQEQQKHANSAAGGRSRSPERVQNRQQVQSQLRALLRDTAALTARLQKQMLELRHRGWNVDTTYTQDYRG